MHTSFQNSQYVATFDKGDLYTLNHQWMSQTHLAPVFVWMNIIFVLNCLWTNYTSSSPFILSWFWKNFVDTSHFSTGPKSVAIFGQAKAVSQSVFKCKDLVKSFHTHREPKMRKYGMPFFLLDASKWIGKINKLMKLFVGYQIAQRNRSRKWWQVLDSSFEVSWFFTLSRPIGDYATVLSVVPLNRWGVILLIYRWWL